MAGSVAVRTDRPTEEIIRTVGVINGTESKVDTISGNTQVKVTSSNTSAEAKGVGVRDSVGCGPESESNARNVFVKDNVKSSTEGGVVHELGSSNVNRKEGLSDKLSGYSCDINLGTFRSDVSARSNDVAEKDQCLVDTATFMSNDGNCNSRRGYEVIRVSPANLNPDLSRSVQDDIQCSDNQSTDSTISRTLNSDRDPTRTVKLSTENVRVYPANLNPDLPRSVQDDTQCSVNQSTDGTIDRTLNSDGDAPRQLYDSAESTITQKQNTNCKDSPEILESISSPCWYLHVEVQHKPIIMLFDTGSATSLLPKAVYENLGSDKPELKEVPSSIKARVDAKLSILGQGLFSFKTEVKQYAWRLIVADIVGERGILGTDFIKAQGRVLHQNTLKWKTKHGDIQLFRGDASVIGRIRVDCSRPSPECAVKPTSLSQGFCPATPPREPVRQSTQESVAFAVNESFRSTYPDRPNVTCILPHKRFKKFIFVELPFVM